MRVLIPNCITSLILIILSISSINCGRYRSRYVHAHGARSGARSAYSLAPFGETFNLFNLFNVFRGSKSKLVDENGDLKPLDSELYSETHLKTTNPLHQGLLKPIAPVAFSQLLLDKFEAKGARNRSSVTSPIVLIPGYGGSRLEAKLNKSRAVRYFCDVKSDWTDIWINVKLLLPYMIDCLIDNLRLEYDYTTNTTRNTEGVEIRVKDESELSSVEYLNNLPIAGFAYYAPIINQLTKAFAYERELNILGAPYDFRKAPNELGDYFDQLKLTCDNTFMKNGHKPITFICHSMGCNNLLFFLHIQSQRWKAKKVKQIITVAAPWAGSMSALKAAAKGDDLGMPYLFSESKLIHIQRSLPSTIYLFPSKHVFNGPLITSNLAPLQNPNLTTFSRKSDLKKKEYKAFDFKSFFEDTDHQDGYQMWLNTKDLLGSIEAPGVETWCLVGQGQKTLGRLEFLGEFPNSPSQEIYDDGDGTVNLQSAKYCTEWSSKQKEKVHYKEFYAGHMEILKDNEVLDTIQNILEGTARF